MNSSKIAAALLFAFASLLSLPQGQAQALPTATANVRLSAFVGLGANLSGIGLSKDGDISAGIDIGAFSFKGFYPSLEGRGLYPIDKNRTVNLENALGGIRLTRLKGNIQGYGDVLFGRGKLTFPLGYPDPTNTYLVLSNTSSVLSFGGGADYFVTQHFGIKADFQFQRYQTPVTVSGSDYSKVFTGALVYRFGTGGLNGLRGRHF